MRITTTVKIIAIIQVFICLFLILNIFVKKNKQPSFSSIDKNSIQKIESENLKYYYEYNPNEKVVDASEFVKKPITFIYNNDGLNDLTNYKENKDANTYRIITIGDSFTYGDHVETKNNWTEILEKKLNKKKICKNIDKFEVINFGVCGYDIQYEIENYKTKGQKYNPDLIIWMLFDQNRINEITTGPTHQCYKENGNGQEYYPDTKTLEKCYTNTIDIIDQDEINNLQINNIKKIHDYYKGNIFFIDFWDFHSEYMNEINSFLKSSQLNDFGSLYGDINKDNKHMISGHPDTYGHEFIGNTIYKSLLNNDQSFCEVLEQK